MRAYVSLSIGLLLLALGQSSAQEIVVATFEDYDPHNTIAAAILRKAYARIGRDMVLKPMPGTRALRSANDALVDADLIRIEGIELEFTNLVRVPFIITTVEFVAFTSTPNLIVNDWHSLLNYRVGYLRGIKLIENKLQSAKYREPENKIALAFKRLSTGQLDVVIDSRLSGLTALHKLQIHTVIGLQPPLSKAPMFHYLNDKHRALVPLLLDALAALQQERIIEQVHEQVERQIGELNLPIENHAVPRLEN